MALTYEPIATTTLTGTATDVTFSTIPNTYTDLILICNAATTVANKDLALQFNGDTTTNYSRTVLYGDGSSAGSTRTTSAAQIFIDYYGWTTTTLGTQINITHIMNYANTTTYKTVLSRSNTSSSGVDANVGLWRKTPEAITSIKILALTSGTFASGSTFTLYGIRSF